LCHQSLTTSSIKVLKGPRPSCSLSLQVTLNGSNFDTLLAAYTGAAVSTLTTVANNDNCTTGGPAASCVTFAVTRGTVYSLQVDGVRGAQGTVRIAVSFVWATPPNDAFSAAVTTLPATGTTLGASLEPGERGAVPGKGASGSVWYGFKAALNGVAQVVGQANRPGALTGPRP
jgi:hypothetical protein